MPSGSPPSPTTNRVVAGGARGALSFRVSSSGVDGHAMRSSDRSSTHTWAERLTEEPVSSPACCNSIPVSAGNYILEKAESMPYRVEDRPALTDLDITPEMLRAGVEALGDNSEASSVFLAKSVFQAMEQARKAAPPQGR